MYSRQMESRFYYKTLTMCQLIAKPFLFMEFIVDVNVFERMTLGLLNSHSWVCLRLSGAARQRVSLIMHLTLFLTLRKDFL